MTDPKDQTNTEEEIISSEAPSPEEISSDSSSNTDDPSLEIKRLQESLARSQTTFER